MVSQALCDRPISQWLVLKSTLSHWLMTPTFIVLPLLILVLLPWMIPRLRWRRFWSGLGTILLVVYFSATFPLTIAVAKKGLVTFLPPDPGTTADAIVVLGRGEPFRDSRVQVAAELWKNHRAPFIFASGVGDGSEIVQKLKAKGIPDAALGEEHCSQTTKENALFTASILQPRGIKKILLVTDSPHMLRSRLTFKNVGFEVISHTTPIPSQLTSTKKAMLMFYEYMGLVSYGLRGNFLKQNLPQQDHPPVAKIKNSANFDLQKQQMKDNTEISYLL
ncbi:YdcF family protein [Brasilonema sp. UFV-L1]|uniref:YdcF family protein n=1 Tax=Brasilonema sp. UFV-L1 TaxID=2234130 RepID=UPI00145D58EF|nr:YdcF family protein [Brasilonema sp. UFV-L1]NMG08182.1 YdcF family protein [Brasilonema sp. UFV-L1]